jgi:galactose-1-phosphate uridylyltransferase
MDKKLMTREEYNKWIGSLPNGYCPFCDWEKVQLVMKIYPNWVWAESNSPIWRYQTMIFPKRHVEDIINLTVTEISEMFEIYKEVVDEYRKHQLVDKDGNIYNKYEFLWRMRDDRYDPKMGIVKVAHFHFNMYPFREHHTDPAIEKDASNYSFRDLLK